MYDKTFSLKRFFICMVLWFAFIGGLWAYGWRRNFNMNQVQDPQTGDYSVQTPFTMEQNKVDAVSPFYETRAADSLHALHEKALMEAGAKTPAMQGSATMPADTAATKK